MNAPERHFYALFRQIYPVRRDTDAPARDINPDRRDMNPVQRGMNAGQRDKYAPPRQMNAPRRDMDAPNRQMNAAGGQMSHPALFQPGGLLEISRGQRPRSSRKKIKPPRPGRRKSPKIFFVVFHPVVFEQFYIFILKRLFPMMFLLLGDVMTNRSHHGNAHREGPITVLPLEIALANRLMHPSRGNPLQIAHHVG